VPDRRRRADFSHAWLGPKLQHDGWNTSAKDRPTRPAEATPCRTGRTRRTQDRRGILLTIGSFQQRHWPVLEQRDRVCGGEIAGAGPPAHDRLAVLVRVSQVRNSSHHEEAGGAWSIANRPFVPAAFRDGSYFEYFRFQRSAKLIKWMPRARTISLTSFEQISATDSACRCE